MSQATVPPLGSRIRIERQRRGLSVRGLARDIGVSPSLISQIETDKSQPSVSTLYAITTALDITIESLFGESDGSATELSPTQDGRRAGVRTAANGPYAGGSPCSCRSPDSEARSCGLTIGSRSRSTRE